MALNLSEVAFMLLLENFDKFSCIATTGIAQQTQLRRPKMPPISGPVGVVNIQHPHGLNKKKNRT